MGGEVGEGGKERRRTKGADADRQCNGRSIGAVLSSGSVPSCSSFRRRPSQSLLLTAGPKWTLLLLVEVR